MPTKPTILVWESIPRVWKFTITLVGYRLVSDKDYHSKGSAELGAFRLCQGLNCKPNFRYTTFKPRVQDQRFEDRE